MRIIYSLMIPLLSTFHSPLLMRRHRSLVAILETPREVYVDDDYCSLQYVDSYSAPQALLRPLLTHVHSRECS